LPHGLLFVIANITSIVHACIEWFLVYDLCSILLFCVLIFYSISFWFILMFFHHWLFLTYFLLFYCYWVAVGDCKQLSREALATWIAVCDC
jgi:hypothetical protein